MAKSKFEIIFENNDFIAINKRSGLLTIPDREQSEKSLKEYLIEKYSSIFVVHRLDKDTSGLVLFAKNEPTHKYLCKIFEERKVEKYYLGIVLGSMPEEQGIIDAPITEHLTTKGLMTIHRSGKESQTGYKVLESYPQYSLISFRLYTGRTHQIRVHAKHVGNPLACDALYGTGKPILISGIKKNYNLSKHVLQEQPIINRLALHAYQLHFDNIQGQRICIEAPAPKEFKALMAQLKK